MVVTSKKLKKVNDYLKSASKLIKKDLGDMRLSISGKKNIKVRNNLVMMEIHFKDIVNAGLDIRRTIKKLEKLEKINPKIIENLEYNWNALDKVANRIKKATSKEKTISKEDIISKTKENIHTLSKIHSALEKLINRFEEHI